MEKKELQRLQEQLDRLESKIDILLKDQKKNPPGKAERQFGSFMDAYLKSIKAGDIRY